MPLPERIYTRSEQAQRARLMAGSLRYDADDTRFRKAMEKVERLNEVAADRYRQEVGIWENQMATAQEELATARVTERAASRHERKDATRARKDAEARLKRVERAKPRSSS